MNDDELKAICERASWPRFCRHCDEGDDGAECTCRADAYVGQARTDIPALLAEVERLRAENKELRAQLREEYVEP
jgi:hypothetical protein